MWRDVTWRSVILLRGCGPCGKRECPLRKLNIYPHFCSPEKYCGSFIWVENFLWLPESLSFSSCFTDYLNNRCQSGQILCNLLQRKVYFEKEEKNKETIQVEFSVLELIKINYEEDIFYSFCLGKIATLDDVYHCPECHVCYEYQIWECRQCGASSAIFCPRKHL